MRSLLVGLWLTLSAFLGPAFGSQATDGFSAPLDCSHGPASLSYGEVPWLVYACSDQRSVVLVSASGSRAAPFYFMFSANGPGYRLIGEGTGSTAATDKVFEDSRA